jgi:uncharacterized protein (TIRG00374 family)
VPPTDTPSRGNRSGRWLHVTVAVVILAGIAFWVDLGSVANALVSLTPLTMVAALLLATADRFMMAFKWWHLLAVGGSPTPFPTTLRIYYQAGVSGRVVPAPLGADVLRAYLASQVGIPGGLAISSVMLERFIAMLTSILLALLGILYLGAQFPEQASGPLFIAIAAVVLGSGIVSLGFVFFVPAQRAAQHLYAGLTARWPLPARVERMLGKVSRSFLDYQSQGRALLHNAGFSLFEHGIQFAKLAVIAAGLGITSDNLPFFAVLAVALFIRRIGGIIEGWGLGEGSGVAVIILLGVEPALAVALFFANFATTTVAILPGAILFFTHPVRLTAREQRPQDS